MYQVSLSESYFPAQEGEPDRLTTIGTMLRSSVASAPDLPALKELGYDGEIGRVWTYSDLLHDAERLARALASRHEQGARVRCTPTTSRSGCSPSSAAPSPA